MAERRWCRSAKAGYYSHPTAAPQQQARSYPEVPLLFPSLRASKPRHDSWTLSLHHVGEATRKKTQSHGEEAADNWLIGSKCAFIPEAKLHLWRWLFLENTNKREREGKEMEINTKGHQLMLSPAASPEAYCSTVPIREGQEVIWTRPQPGPGKCTSALTCYIKPGDEESLWLWLLLTQKPAADTVKLLYLVQNGRLCNH